MTEKKKTASAEEQRQLLSEKSRKKNGKKNLKKRKTGKWLTGILLILILITLTVCLSYTVFFKVKAVETEGESIYSSEQIIQSSGIYEGQSMLSISTEEVSSKVCKTLPFIKTAEVRRILPSTVRITVTAETAALSAKYGESFLTLSEDLKVLEETDQITYPVIVGSQINSGEPGEKIVMADGVTETLERLKSAFLSTEIEDISVIDLTDPDNIKLLYKESFVLELGSDDLLEYKLKFCIKVAQSEQGQGVIDVKYVSESNKKGFFSPKTVKDQINLP